MVHQQSAIFQSFRLFITRVLPRLHALLKWPLLLSATPQVQPLTILSILIIAAKLIEEALLYFRPNVLHRSFEILGPADRTLAYLFLVISECLGRLGSQIAKGPAFDAGRRLLVGHLQQVGTAFAIPGDAGFPLNGLFPAPASRQESGNRVLLFMLYIAFKNNFGSTCTNYALNWSIG